VRVEVITIFPDLVEHYASRALLGRARAAGVLDLRVHDLRSAATDPHRSVDDSPFGGGAGMVLSAVPIVATIEAVRPVRPLLLLGPGGRRFDQHVARALASAVTAGAEDAQPAPAGGSAGTAGAGTGSAGTAGAGTRAGHIGGDPPWLERLAAAVATSGGFTLLCGRYEGVDHRVAEHLVDGELSIGDVVLAGGELAALVVVEAITRLLPGAMGNEASPEDESFTDGLLEYPQYTRPAELRGWSVPAVLRSGDHGQVARWRRAMALRRTLRWRPDLIEARGGLTDEERRLVDALDDDDGAGPADARVPEEATGGAAGQGRPVGPGGPGPAADRLGLDAQHEEATDRPPHVSGPSGG
jgi:tRNA (guanine37-N1)-methyltransferase